MIFQLAKNSHFLQRIVIDIVTAVHPSIEHNLEKVGILKKAFFHCELEKVEGSYFEFGMYEGASLYSALRNYQRLGSDIPRKFYGFDSFDDGFKYVDEKDAHPFFKEGDFVSSYEKAKKRFRKYGNVHITKGYFEETIAGRNAATIFPGETCAVAFIDCDLSTPARIALDFIGPMLQKGSVVILDDYWAYKGDPGRGTCGAFRSFLRDNPRIKARPYYRYGHGGMSFVVYAV